MQSTYTRIAIGSNVLPVTFQVRKHYGVKGSRRPVAVARVLGPQRDSYDRIIVEPSAEGSGFTAYPESSPKKAITAKRSDRAFAQVAELHWK